MGTWQGVEIAKRTPDGGFEYRTDYRRCICGRNCIAVAVKHNMVICKACATEAIQAIDAKITELNKGER